MEYLQKKYFPFKTVIIDHSLQITLEKKIAKCHLEFSYFFICTATGIILHLQLLIGFYYKERISVTFEPSSQACQLGTLSPRPTSN